jgi:hypothetical protein
VTARERKKCDQRLGLETQKARFNGLGKKLHETLRFLPKNLRNP